MATCFWPAAVSDMYTRSNMKVRSSCIASSGSGAMTTAPAAFSRDSDPSTTASIMAPTIALPGSPKTARAVAGSSSGRSTPARTASSASWDR